MHPIMNTRPQASISRALPGVLLLPFLLLFSARPSFAVAGVLDSVVITEDLTDSYKWAREHAEWQTVGQLLTQQLETQKVLLQRVGATSESVSRVLTSVESVSNSMSGLVAIEDRDGAVEEGKAQAAAGKKGDTQLRADAKVSNTFKVLGKVYQRNQELYQHLGALEALHDRGIEASKSLDEIAKQELDAQKGLLQKLKTAATQADLLAVQAALSASSQRLQVAKLKCEQARDDFVLAEAKIRAETGRKQVADKEQAEQVADCLKARALSALEAQKDKSL
jgi:hypothetical protein